MKYIHMFLYLILNFCLIHYFLYLKFFRLYYNNRKLHWCFCIYCIAIVHFLELNPHTDLNKHDILDFYIGEVHMIHCSQKLGRDYPINLRGEICLKKMVLLFVFLNLLFWEKRNKKF